MPDLIIKNARILINGDIQPAEIAIDAGKISKIGKIINERSFNRVINAKGALVLPGAIDVHVHFRDPGMTRKEDWYTGSCAAAAGGVTTVIDHPNTDPPTIDPDSFRIKQKAANKSIVDYGINSAVTGNLEHLKDMWEKGAMSFGEIFMAESTGSLNVNNFILKEALGIIGKMKGLACIHAEDEEINRKSSSLLKHDLSPGSYSRSRPSLSEKIAVERAIKLAGNTKLHFCHISSRESVEIIRKTKSENKITCEVAPHHLFLSTKDWDRLGTLGKMNPPLRDFRSQKSLWAGINDGIIDIVASDHAPHQEHEKMTDIWEAPAGVPGVETILPLMLMAVKQNRLTLNKLVEVMCINPARIFNLNKGIIAPGYDADLTITGDVKKIKKENMHSRSGWTPYNGMEGMFPKITISRGEIIQDEGEITGKRGHGRFIPGPGIKKNNSGTD